MIGVVLSLSLSLGSLEVGGSSACPTPEAVAAQLGRLPHLDQGHRLLLAPAPGGVRLSLHRRSGELVAEKTLQGAGSCPELAAAAAVVAASWLAELQVGTLAPPPPEAPLQQGPSPAPELGFDVAAGLSGSLSGGSLSLGIILATSLTPGERPLGARLSFETTGARLAQIAPGWVSWQRFGLGLGGQWRFWKQDWKLDLSLEAVPALLAVVGEEGTKGASRTVFDLGGSAGVRALSAPGLWVGLHANGWLMPRPVELEGAALRLPRLELLLAGGLSWGNR